MYKGVWLEGRAVRLTPSMAVGKGGEADIFKIGNGLALKVFKPPDHPDFYGQPLEQAVAKGRIAEHQKKLPQFPRGLPPHVVVPLELAYDRVGGTVVGYSMQFLAGAEVLMRYSERNFRAHGIPNAMVAEIFTGLHSTVAGVHQRNVVIGDFNDLNVMVDGKEAFIIDADSFQFGPYTCKVFTDRFLDPLLCDARSRMLVLKKPYSPESDWYAFAALLMQTLLLVGPYGGVYVPKNAANRVPQDKRPLKRITVFHPEVRYPRPAIPYEVLPDDLLEFFHRTFEKDVRGEFPLDLLHNLRWVQCPNCGTEHARGVCPSCKAAPPAAVVKVEVVRGQVSATRVFSTKGLIVFAAYQGRHLRFLYHENGEFRRESGDLVIRGGIDPLMRFRIRGDDTLIAKSGQVVTIGSTGQERQSVDSYGLLPIFDANEKTRFWVQNGRLLRDGQFGPDYIGDVLDRQTLFWVGRAFGFGFYRAGAIEVAFVFDIDRHGINDSVDLPKIRGQLVDSTCVFAGNRCWFFVTTRQAGRTKNQCVVVKSDGSVEATAEAESDDGSWLGQIRGKAALGEFLFVPTDDGVVRVEIQNGVLEQTKVFPDTQSWVDAGTHLFVGQEGLYAVGRKEVWLIKFN